MNADRTMVLSVIRDGNRIDRYLSRGDDGHLYTDTHNSEDHDAVYIPVGHDTTEEEEEALAEALIAQV